MSFLISWEEREAIAGFVGSWPARGVVVGSYRTRVVTKAAIIMVG
jgi:hypothetical protein